MMILGLDPGWKPGWAVGPAAPGQPIDFGTLELSRKHGAAGRPEALDFFCRWLTGICARHGVVCIVVEAPLLQKVDRSEYHGSLLRTGMFVFSELHARRIGARFVPVAVPSLRAFWTGSGGAKNGAMTGAVRAAYPELRIADDHQADALGLLDVARERLGAAFRLTG